MNLLFFLKPATCEIPLDTLSLIPPSPLVSTWQFIERFIAGNAYRTCPIWPEKPFTSQDFNFRNGYILVKVRDRDLNERNRCTDKITVTYFLLTIYNEIASECRITGGAGTRSHLINCYGAAVTVVRHMQLKTDIKQ